MQAGIILRLFVLVYGLWGLVRINNSLTTIKNTKIAHILFSIMESNTLTPNMRKNIHDCIESEMFESETYIQFANFIESMGLRSLGTKYLLKGIKCFEHRDLLVGLSGPLLLENDKPDTKMDESSAKSIVHKIYDFVVTTNADTIDSQMYLFSKKWLNEADFIRAKLMHEIHEYLLEIEEIYRNIHGMMYQSVISVGALTYNLCSSPFSAIVGVKNRRHILTLNRS